MPISVHIWPSRQSNHRIPYSFSLKATPLRNGFPALGAFSKLIQNTISGISAHKSPKIIMPRHLWHRQEKLAWSCVSPLLGNDWKIIDGQAFLQIAHSTICEENASAKMDTYLEDLLLPQNHQICDSVVRRYSIHSEKLFSIEQEISISVMSLGEQWVGMFEAFPN